MCCITGVPFCFGIDFTPAGGSCIAFIRVITLARVARRARTLQVWLTVAVNILAHRTSITWFLAWLWRKLCLAM